MSNTKSSLNNIERQNILNNPYVVEPLQKGIWFNYPVIEGEMRITVQQVADFFEVSKRTIERRIQEEEEELKKNWYEMFTWKRLKEAKEVLLTDNNVGQFWANTKAVGLFNFRSFLNIWMLLSQSDKAKELRWIILDVVVDVMNKKTWWNTKYINQRDENYINTYVSSKSYRKNFTNALHEYVNAWPFKFPLMTNKIYNYLFWEDSREYRKLLKLWVDEKNIRSTFYTEVLTAVSTIETWFAHHIKMIYEKNNRQLSYNEVEDAFEEFVWMPVIEPQVETARRIMASRDKWLRDIIHEALTPYLDSLTPEEYEKFLGEEWDRTEEKTKKAIEVIDNNEDVFIRLRDQ